MKRAKYILTLLILLMLMPQTPLCAQQGTAMRNGKLMPYIIEGNDTIFLSPLAAARIYEKKPRQKGRQWRKYYKLVYNFAAVYPYALVAKQVVLQADSTIKAEKMKYIRKDKYVEGIVKELFHSFEKPMRSMSISQGQLLMKLIDRECNITSYNIIRDFKNRFAAGFWQGMAKLFGNDLKKHYDPLGDDAATEDLVHKWHDGSFEQLYFEIFWTYPPMIELPPQYRIPNPYLSRSPVQQAPKQEKVSASRKRGSVRK